MAKDIEKRKRVMQRSMRLGHCICDARKPCPCDLVRELDVCLCAGERLPVSDVPVRLTRLVESPGCASKIDQASLKKALANLPEFRDPHVLIGMPAGDDAGVYQLDERTALVQTVDVFAPSVDDPYTFGQIAAANSLSDIYAMGSRPISALSVIEFPIRELPDRVLREILRGGIDKMSEAAVPVIGGHSINGRQIKAGFAVTGLAEPERIVANSGARPGDALVLTKPIGTGMIAFAAQIDRSPAEAMAAAAKSMAALNKTSSELMIECGAHACTDITGFGLMGHLGEMAASSGVDVEITWDDIPLFPGVLECLAEGVIPGATERNRESSGGRAVAGQGVTPLMLEVCFDPQTSGGLLIALPPDKARRLIERLREAGVSGAAVIGKVLGEGTGRVNVETTGKRRISDRITGVPPVSPLGQAHGQDARATDAGRCCADYDPTSDCCEPGKMEGQRVETAAGTDAQAKFQAFMQSATAPGALDVHTKEAIALALCVLARCEPCLKAHIKKARSMGFSQAEIDEAAWMAVSFGGSPTMMFYTSVMKKED